MPANDDIKTTVGFVDFFKLSKKNFVSWAGPAVFNNNECLKASNSSCSSSL